MKKNLFRLIIILLLTGLSIAALAGCGKSKSGGSGRGYTYNPLGPADSHIHVDQFGYLPDAEKIAVIANPQTGYNSADSFTPGTSYEIRKAVDNSLVYANAPVQWNGGAEDTISGDIVWHFDFSSVTADGDYYVYDPTNDVSSYRFSIRNDIYRDVLRAAFRTFYYQRCGITKQVPYAEADWADPAACHVGTEQDLDCRDVATGNVALSKDLSRGWHDAGDHNKYINFADDPLHDLLFAYEENPAVWTDDMGLPESGNGVPDLLDEIKWELDWFLNMQNADGSVLGKVAVTNYASGSPPSSDTDYRRYAPALASSTIAACGAYAHAAIVYKAQADAGMQAYGATLETAAIDAWTWLVNNPGLIPSTYDNAGFVNADGEDGTAAQAANRVAAACYLFALTGNTTYRDYVDNNYAADITLIGSSWADTYDNGYYDALICYGEAPGATSATVNDFLGKYIASVQTSYLSRYQNDDDAYRAYVDTWQYHWGGNSLKCEWGILFMKPVHHGLDAANDTDYTNGAAGKIHYIHGVNPLNLVYLTHMDDLGAENSCTELYHGWFNDGTDWDSTVSSLYGPLPGIMPGGPNENFAPDAAYAGPPLDPPMNQPPAKSYKDWNTGWPENSWEITENSITYQAAYVRLLANFVK